MFTLAIATGRPCTSGNSDANDGREPGCAPCPIGTYWTNPQTCTPCPAGNTTFVYGATSVSQCNRRVVNASTGYTMFDRTYYCESFRGIAPSFV
jgi:hypothetical protein